MSRAAPTAIDQQLLREPPPALAATSQALRKLLLRDAPQAQLLATLRQDPALLLAVMSSAGRAVASRRSSGLHHPGHALSLLGRLRLRQIVETLPVIEPDTHPQGPIYLRALGISHHAAVLATAWARHRHLDQDRFATAALLAGAPLWRLALSAPYADDWPAAPPPTPARASWATLAEFGASRWHLPEEAQRCWQTQELGRPGSWLRLQRPQRYTMLQRWRSQLPVGVRLANELAWAAAWNWSDRECRRWLRLSALWLHLPVEGATSLAHRSAAIACRDPLLTSSKPNPAERLLWPGSDPAPASSIAPVLARLRSLSPRGPRATVPLLLRALLASAGFARASVAIWGDGAWQHMGSAGEPWPSPQWPLPAAEGTPLALLTGRSGALLLKPEQHPAWTTLPTCLRAGKGLALCAMTGKAHAWLLLADNGNSGPAPDEQQYRLLRRMAAAARPSLD